MKYITKELINAIQEKNTNMISEIVLDLLIKNKGNLKPLELELDMFLEKQFPTEQERLQFLEEIEEPVANELQKISISLQRKENYKKGSGLWS